MKRINPTSLIIELKYCIIATYTYFIKAYSLLFQEKESVEDKNIKMILIAVFKYKDIESQNGIPIIFQCFS